MDLDSVSAQKHAKKELGQHTAILTSHLVNNPYILAARVDCQLFALEGIFHEFRPKRHASTIVYARSWHLSFAEKVEFACFGHCRDCAAFLRLGGLNKMAKAFVARAAGAKRPRGVLGHAPPENFLK